MPPSLLLHSSPGLSRLQEMVAQPETYIDGLRYVGKQLAPMSQTESEHAQLYNRLSDELKKTHGGASGSITDRAKNYGGAWDYATRNPDEAKRKAELWQFADYLRSILPFQSTAGIRDAGSDLDENLAGIQDAVKFVGPPEPYKELKQRSIDWAEHHPRSFNQGGLAHLAGGGQPPKYGQNPMEHTTSSGQMDPKWEEYLASQERPGNMPPLEAPLLDPLDPFLLPKSLPVKLGKGYLKMMAEAIARGAERRPNMIPGAVPSYVIKNKGGNWLSGSVEDALKGLKRDYGSIQGAAINSWSEKQLKNYVRNEMATPEDPIRALAEQGTLHYAPNELQPGAAWLKGRTEAGKSPLAKVWEAAADQIPQKAPYNEHTAIGVAGDTRTPEDLLREIGGEFAVKNPTAQAYAFNRGKTPTDLGFDHLIDELSNATNPNSGLPAHLLLDPAKLNRVSVPDAVRKVADINAWREAEAAKARIANLKNSTVHKEYPEGYKWITVPDTETPEGMALAKQLGCESGWCTQGESAALQYGSKGNKLHVLIDPEGKAHVQVQVIPSEYEKLRNDPAYAKAFEEDPSLLTPSISQIKGRFNKAPDKEHLPYVQDLVKSGKWSDVGDLQNTGLQATRLPDGTVKYHLPDEVLDEIPIQPDQNFAQGGPVTNDFATQLAAALHEPTFAEQLSEALA